MWQLGSNMDLRHCVAFWLWQGFTSRGLRLDCMLISRRCRVRSRSWEELGAHLFVRTTRSTQLTRAGRLFLEHVPRVFAALDQARSSVKSAANGFHGQLRITLSDGITPSRLPALLAQSREEDPEVEVRLFEVPLVQQIKGLRDDLYDAGFSMAEDTDEGIVVAPAWERTN